ncbi:hypothetical protein DM01DRAFT_1386845 [Hesseltinella vesiculosa]|uniref:Uncharacterized protein n=1 Tax=Hesseltinella vesiculosa TaxID=101127 RepID=A0A1X2G4E7_9FUNG|nr:hypothetical protein DM01DRAFT_1386845 [Hesseltinella vesiculosa]
MRRTETFRMPFELRKHFNAHGLKAPTRPQKRRSKYGQYEYVDDDDPRPQEVHHACPICEEHSMSFASIAAHFYSSHGEKVQKAASNKILAMESDIHQLLALSSILLVKRHHSPPSLAPYFPEDLLAKIIEQRQNHWQVPNKFPDDTMVPLMNIARVSIGVV